jgi:CRP-like cAMP-binding protein
MEARTSTGNGLLTALASEDFALLIPLLTRVDLPVRKQLEFRERKAEYVYFPQSGLASVVAKAARQELEIGIIGKEGLVGICLLHEVQLSAHETFMQIAGTGWRIPASDFQQAVSRSPSMRHLFLQYAHTMFIQLGYSALAAGRQKIDTRLARWLLMAQDRADGPVVELTHEFLAIMLGTRRPGVTVALQALVLSGAIETSRGHVTVVNRQILEDAADGGYGEPEKAYRRIVAQAA